MLMRTDPFRELDRLVERMWGTAAHPAGIPMDAWRDGDTFFVELDLPGVDPESIDLGVERNVLTVKAETLDTERIDASYEAGVLRLRIPVAEQAKPRKIAISGGSGRKELNS